MHSHRQAPRNASKPTTTRAHGRAAGAWLHAPLTHFHLQGLRGVGHKLLYPSLHLGRGRADPLRCVEPFKFASVSQQRCGRPKQ